MAIADNLFPEHIAARQQFIRHTGHASSDRIATCENVVKLDRHTIKQYQPEIVRQSLEFQAFCDRVDVWHDLVAFPLSDASSAAEKLTIALLYVCGDGEWGDTLLRAVAAVLSFMHVLCGSIAHLRGHRYLRRML